MENNTVKPFIKWLGGKRRLIKNIEKYYPFNKKINKYIEPFLGGGAILFDILNKFDLEEIHINDLSYPIYISYKLLKEKPTLLIENILKIKEKYNLFNNKEKEECFFNKKTKFNEILKKLSNKKMLSDTEELSFATFFYF